MSNDKIRCTYFKEDCKVHGYNCSKYGVTKKGINCQHNANNAPRPEDSSGSNSTKLLSGELWKLARKEFTQMADKQGWDLNEHPLHAVYLNGDTQMYWEIFKAGFTAAI
jgi:hypothetical protein